MAAGPQHLLTALELLVEAQEAGAGHEVASLEAFFRNPRLFPPEAVAAATPRAGTWVLHTRVLLALPAPGPACSLFLPPLSRPLPPALCAQL